MTDHERSVFCALAMTPACPIVLAGLTRLDVGDVLDAVYALVDSGRVVGDGSGRFRLASRG